MKTIEQLETELSQANAAVGRLRSLLELVQKDSIDPMGIEMAKVMGEIYRELDTPPAPDGWRPIIEHDQLGPEEIQTVIENQKFPNWCIHPNVMAVKAADIGEWSDDHPMNCDDSMESEYERIFP